jgi:hypothetical protein
MRRNAPTADASRFDIMTLLAPLYYDIELKCPDKVRFPPVVIEKTQ